MGFRGRPIRVESGFLELTTSETVPEAGCELMCGHLGSPLLFLSFSNPPSTLFSPFTRLGIRLQSQPLLASEGLSFSSIDEIFSTSNQWLSSSTRTWARLPRTWKDQPFRSGYTFSVPSPVWDCKISRIFYLFHLFKF